MSQLRIVVLLCASLCLCLIGSFLESCRVQLSNATPDQTPLVAGATEFTSPAFSTSTSSPAPASVATALSPTSTESLATPVPLSTIFSSPTPLVGSATTSGIIEVTALPVTPGPGLKINSVHGYFKPFGNSWVRPCPYAASYCPPIRQLVALKTVEFYAAVTVWPSGNVWLCLDPSTSIPEGYTDSACAEVVAYLYNDEFLGEEAAYALPSGG